MRLKRLTITQKRGLWGLLFILPFIIGFMLFFAYPMILSAKFSVSRLTVIPTGYELEHIGFKNFRDAFVRDPVFIRNLVDSLKMMATDVPLIIMFSFFAANLLNQKFKGRTVARVIFFLPVIMASGILASIASGELERELVQTAANAGQSSKDVTGNFFRSMRLLEYLFEIGLHPMLISYVVSAVSRINEIINESGVQILLFLSALQTIPPSLYEASSIEGATGWENFWKITFPMLSPYILTNTVYTVINSFTSSKNVVMAMVVKLAFGSFNFTYSSALSWIYFIIVSIILFFVTWAMSKKVYYYR